MIVVETKSPESGQLRLSYSGNYGISFADLSDYNLMNASEKLEYELLAGRYSPLEGYDGFVDKLQKMQDYYTRLKEVLRGVDTYWLNEPLRTVFNHSHNLYIDGGDQAMRYGLGISYNNRDGVMKKSDRDGLGVNIDLFTVEKVFCSRTKRVWIFPIRNVNRWLFPVFKGKSLLPEKTGKRCNSHVLGEKDRTLRGRYVEPLVRVEH